MKKILLIVSLLMVTFAARALPFVTTPSSTTLPIHWYQLIINNGKYVYFDPNASIFDQIKLTPTASTEDNFLWCFIQVSSDKILIYNRAAHGYFEEDQFVTSDINSSYLCHVVERAAGGFFIRYYHTGDGRNYYLYEYIGDGLDFLSSASAALSTSIFNVNEVFVEGDNVPVAGDVNGDDEVSIADVTMLVDLLLRQQSNERSDVNGDGETSIADLTSLVDIVAN
ncbi:MAG: dockerin type I repeat-containing protein [Muribaculaceae bacterium]|nr:dockerin type I repeat-containing protein [Muribaculaceae bacterium]